MKGDTPLTNAVEYTRRKLKQQRTPAYGDMMAHAKRLERLLYDQSALICILASNKKSNER